MSKVKGFMVTLLAPVMFMAVIGAALLLQGCGDDDEGTGPVATPKTPLAYIYGTDSTAGTEARTLLAAYDYTVRMVSIDSVDSEDFSGDSLIFVDNNTEDEWGNLDAAAVVLNSGKPVIAMGEGGYDFYGAIGLNIGSPHGAHDSGTAVIVLPACSSLVTTPHQVTVPADSTLYVYSDSCGVVSIYDPPAGVTQFAYYPGDDRYPELVEEQGRFFLWGFGGPVTQMTTAGSNLFVNTIKYMLSQ